ncbi:MAG: hypothetical protein K2N95_13475 [Lachnospiraceae bacterium]|nr:hypothetical protein [Lachnospiraceae bacterium]
MVYKYCENRNFEDLASGKVIVHRAGYPNFPVRLAQEIFSRCLHYLDNPDSVCIYDPCCGGGYLLTVLGFLNFERIKTIIASDISDDAIQLTDENLSLLDKNGLRKRIRQIKDLLSLHNKNSHIEALNSATNLFDILANSTHEIERKVFKTDILSNFPLDKPDFKADIIFTDVPYGNLVEWQNRNKDNSNLLDQLLPVTKEKTVVAICSDKSQKFQSDNFQRIEKQVIGKRLFQIYKLGNPGVTRQKKS